MKLCLARLCPQWALLWLVLPTLATGRGLSSRKFLEEPSDLVSYQKLPGIPSDEMAVEQNEAAKTSLGWAENEEASSALHAATAENAEAAATAELITKYQGLKMKSATMRAIVSAQKAGEMRKRAEAAAKRSEVMVAEMPAVALKAAHRAIEDTVNAAMLRMDEEATIVAKEQAKLERKLQGDAAKAAQVAALPWQQAKVRAGETMISYLAQARDLANAVTHLKLMAPELSKQAGVLQSRGDVVRAQEHQIAAKDLLDKASQLESQALSFNKMANKINSGIGMYDLSAGAAASYASYTANPGGGVGRQSLPPLPYPLKLLPPPSPGPGPAPAPAPAS